MKTYDNWIDGGYVASPNDLRMATTTPFTGEVWA